jgi:aminoglycoside phosphotransferase (APT) family kinase protein
MAAMPVPWQRDLEADRKRLCDWLASKLPGARDVAISPLAAPQATGFSNETLLFDLEWSEAGRRERRSLVARVEPIGFTVFPEYDLSLQYRTMQILGRTDVPVPRVLWLEPADRSVLGAPFYVMERVAGRVPTDQPPYHAGGWLTEVAPEERAAIWWSGLDALARIHRLDWRALGFGFLERPALGATPFEQQLEHYRRYFAWAARGWPQPTAEAALAWLERRRPQEDEPALVWGDARIGNVIFDGGRAAAVLDWEMVTLGDPAQDLAWWLFLDAHHSEGIGVPRLPGFPSHDDTVARWEALTRRSAGDLHYWKVWAGFRFAVIMMRIAQQLVRYGVLPPDSDLETNNTCTRMLARLLDLPPPRA